MRASMAAATCCAPSSRNAPCAKAARVETGNTGRSAAKASPWVTPVAMRTPVKLPGPRPKAMASSALNVSPLSASTSCTMGNNSAACSRGASCERACTVSPSSRATEQNSVALSRASIFTGWSADRTRACDYRMKCGAPLPAIHGFHGISPSLSKRRSRPSMASAA